MKRNRLAIQTTEIQKQSAKNTRHIGFARTLINICFFLFLDHKNTSTQLKSSKFYLKCFTNVLPMKNVIKKFSSNSCARKLYGTGKISFDAFESGVSNKHL